MQHAIHIASAYTFNVLNENANTWQYSARIPPVSSTMTLRTCRCASQPLRTCIQNSIIGNVWGATCSNHGCERPKMPGGTHPCCPARRRHRRHRHCWLVHRITSLMSCPLQACSGRFRSSQWPACCQRGRTFDAAIGNEHLAIRPVDFVQELHSPVQAVVLTFGWSIARIKVGHCGGT